MSNLKVATNYQQLKVGQFWQILRTTTPQFYHGYTCRICLKPSHLAGEYEAIIFHITMMD